jgi:hypothetical protein
MRLRTGILVLFLASALSGFSARANSITTSVGDREVTFKLIQKKGKAMLATESNDLGHTPLELNETNRKFFVEMLKKACNRTEYEVNTRRYQIEINREENGRKIRCIYGFNSTSPKARIARNALDVLTIAINTAESVAAPAK